MRYLINRNASIFSVKFLLNKQLAILERFKKTSTETYGIALAELGIARVNSESSRRCDGGFETVKAAVVLLHKLQSNHVEKYEKIIRKNSLCKK